GRPLAPPPAGRGRGPHWRPPRPNPPVARRVCGPPRHAGRRLARAPPPGVRLVTGRTRRRRAQPPSLLFQQSAARDPRRPSCPPHSPTVGDRAAIPGSENRVGPRPFQTPELSGLAPSRAARRRPLRLSSNRAPAPPRGAPSALPASAGHRTRSLRRGPVHHTRPLLALATNGPSAYTAADLTK